MRKHEYDHLNSLVKSLQTATNKDEQITLLKWIHTLLQQVSVFDLDMATSVGSAIRNITPITVKAVSGQFVSDNEIQKVISIVTKTIQGNYFSDYNGPVMVLISKTDFVHENIQSMPSTIQNHEALRRNGQVIVFSTKEKAVSYIFEHQKRYFGENVDIPTDLLDFFNTYSNTCCITGTSDENISISLVPVTYI